MTALSALPALATPVEVVAFWFGQAATPTPRAEWFRKDAAFDALIRSRFGATVQAALDGGLREWAAHRASALAYIVVLDQFTRNAFRDTARAFAGDALALQAAQALVASGGHLQLSPLQRWFVYLPFEHAEDLGLQAQSLQLFGALAAAHPALADAHLWAQKHQAVITRFGRYPHRNALLGRESTAEERVFLLEPGSAF